LYADNRTRLFDIMGDGVAIVPAAAENFRNADTEYNFHQEMSFHYLTGLDEPDAIAVLAQKGKRRTLTLFVHPKDPKVELWTGRRLGPPEAKKMTGAQHCHPISEFGDRAPELMLGHPVVHMPLGSSFPHEPMLLKNITSYQCAGHKKGAPRDVRDIQALVGESRLLKSVDEIDRIRQAVRVTELGVLEAMAAIMPASCTTPRAPTSCATGTCASSTPAPRSTTTPPTSRAPFRSTDGLHARRSVSTAWCSTDSRPAPRPPNRVIASKTCTTLRRKWSPQDSCGSGS
jgi:hypothetical protein